MNELSKRLSQHSSSSNDDPLLTNNPYNSTNQTRPPDKNSDFDEEFRNLANMVDEISDKYQKSYNNNLKELRKKRGQLCAAITRKIIRCTQARRAKFNYERIQQLLHELNELEDEFSQVQNSVISLISTPFELDKEAEYAVIIDVRIKSEQMKLQEKLDKHRQITRSDYDSYDNFLLNAPTKQSKSSTKVHFETPTPNSCNEPIPSTSKHFIPPTTSQHVVATQIPSFNPLLPPPNVSHPKHSSVLSRTHFSSKSKSGSLKKSKGHGRKSKLTSSFLMDISLSSESSSSRSSSPSSPSSSNGSSPPSSPSSSSSSSSTSSSSSSHHHRHGRPQRRHRRHHRCNCSTDIGKKLPILRIEKFTGKDKTKFISFWTSFENIIHRNKKLKKDEKFAYLKSFLEEDALALVSTFPTRGSFYKPALLELHRRYGRTQTIIDAIIQRFDDIKSSDNFAIFRTSFLEAYSTIMTLKSLGRDINAMSEVLIPVLKRKIPYAIRRTWNEKAYKMERKNKRITITKFLEFLRDKILTMEEPPPRPNSKPSTSSKSKKKIIPYKGLQVTTSSSHTRNTSLVLSFCFVCGKTPFHPVERCEAAKQVGQKQLLLLAKHMGICFRCLSSKHMNKECKAKPCAECKGNHHTLLHSSKIKKLDSILDVLDINHILYDDENDNEATSQDSSSEPEEKDEIPNDNFNLNENTTSSNDNEETEDTSALVTNNLNDKNKTILLQTLQITLQSPTGEEIQASAILDTGAQGSFVTENIVDLLGLVGKPKRLSLHTVGTNNPPKIYSMVTFNIKFPKKTIEMTAIVIPSITSCTDSVKLSKKWTHIKGLKMNNQYPKDKTQVDVLIGLEFYDEIVKQKKIYGNEGEPIALETEGGWIVYGKCDNTSILHVKKTDTQKDLDILWNQDIIPIEENKWSMIDQQALDHYQDTTIYDAKNKCYIVRLPFKNPDICLPNNFTLAFQRLVSNERRMAKDPILHKKFNMAMEELIKGEFCEKITPEMKSLEKTGKIWYLPCQAVVKDERASTTCRIVFDGSSVFKGESLNNQLLTGPKLQPDLVKLLLNFRKGKYTLTADIKKMFNNVRMNIQDRDFLRFLYRTNIHEKPEEFRFSRVIFGLNPSPFQSIHTIQEHSRKMIDQYPLAAEVILSYMYVDDLIYSHDNEKTLIKLKSDLQKLFLEGGFTITKFTSNSTSILKHIPKEERNPKALLPICDCDADPTDISFKTLGLVYNATTDDFQFHLSSLALSWKIDQKITKRIMLSRASQIFDPIGYITPVIVPFKILLQDTWLKECDWDSDVPLDIVSKWQLLEDDLRIAPMISIPRHINFGHQVSKLTLHGFCDASQRCYAAAVYARMESQTGVIRTCLLSSKSRLAPIKIIKDNQPVSLPRLELNAAVLLTQLMTYVCEIFQYDGPLYLYSDSMVVLHWLQTEPGKFKIYVANRIKYIQDNTKPESWRYVKSKENPADIPSRGLTASEFIKCTLWKYGPHWLTDPIATHPQPLHSFEENLEDVQIETRTKSLMISTQKTPLFDLATKNTELRFSTLPKTLRLLELIHLGVDKFKQKNKVKKAMKGILPPYCMKTQNKILLQLIKEQQQATWPEEISALKNKEGLPKSSKLTCLIPYLDRNGLMKTKGRLRKHEHELILLPQCDLTNLIITQKHQDNLCSGTEQTTANLQQNYWIFGGKRYIRSIIKKCFKCKRFHAKRCQQQMGPLPDFRQKCFQCFQDVGLDAFGPLSIMNSTPAYGLIFTCAVMRAVHLELVPSLKSDDILAAIERFIARRGKPTTFHSDNASSFRRLGGILIKDDEIQKQLGKKGISWTFIPPLSPWHGGFYERLIQSVKRPLRIALGQNRLDYHNLQTLLTQIEGIINNRPLTYVSEDINDLRAITPAQLLTGYQIDSNLNTKITSETQIGKMFRLRMRLSNIFWKRWKGEYIKKLLPYHKWITKQPNIQEGDLVLVEDKLAPRSYWPLGRVIKVYVNDGKVRVVDLKMAKNKVIKRSIQSLYFLEEGPKPTLQNKQENLNQIQQEKTTKCGRIIKKPQKYHY